MVRLGCGGVLILALLGTLRAQTTSPANSADSGSLPVSPAAPTPSNSQSTGSGSDNSQSQDNSQNRDNSQGGGNSPSLTNPAAPGTSQVPNTPLLPQQAANPYQPFSSASSADGQSPQLTTPSLFTTGTNDVSQIATNAALASAFSQQPVSGFLSETGAGYSHPPIERILLGPFDLKAAINFTVVSDDNIQGGGGGAPGQGKMSDTSLALTPAILLQYGTHEEEKGYASLVYSPTLTRFLHYSVENSDNQNAAFNASYAFQRLTLNLSQTYSESTGINLDSNSRTTQTSSVTSFGGSYDIDDKLSFSSYLQEVITSFSNGEGEDDEITSVNSSLPYHLSDKITLSPSFNIGMEQPKAAPKQTFEQGLMGINYLPTAKINLYAQGGAEFRQYDSGSTNGQPISSASVVNPIFSAGSVYTPFDSTSLSFNAFQSVHSSNVDAGQTNVDTGVGISATQRFLQRFYLNFTFNYTHESGQSNTGAPPPTNVVVPAGSPPPLLGNGSEDNFVYRPSLSFAPTAWSSIAIYYSYLENESNTPGTGYHDNQLGISISAQF